MWFRLDLSVEPPPVFPHPHHLSCPFPLCEDQGNGLSFSPNKCEATPVNWAVQIGPYGPCLVCREMLSWPWKEEGEQRREKTRGKESVMKAFLYRNIKEGLPNLCLLYC